MRKNFPELYDETNRIKYFAGYEYPGKQQDLLRYWTQSIDKFLSEYSNSFSFKIDDIIQQFVIEKTRPMCIPTIMEVLTRDQSTSDYICLENLNDKENQNKLNVILKSNKVAVKNGEGFIQSLISPLKNSFKCYLWADNEKDNLKKLPVSDTIVNKQFLKSAYEKAVKDLEVIFDCEEFLTTDCFDSFAEQYLHLDYNNLLMVKHLLMTDGKLFEVEVYCNGRKRKCQTRIGPNDKRNQKMHQLIFELPHKILYIEGIIDELQEQVDKKETEIIGRIRANKKEGVKKIIREKKLIEKRIETYGNKKLLLDQCLFNMKNMIDNDEELGCLKEYNKIMESHSDLMDEFRTAKDHMDSYKQYNKELDNMVNSGSDSDLDSELEEMYKNAEDGYEKEKKKSEIDENKPKGQNSLFSQQQNTTVFDGQFQSKADRKKEEAEISKDNNNEMFITKLMKQKNNNNNKNDMFVIEEDNQEQDNLDTDTNTSNLAKKRTISEFN